MAADLRGRPLLWPSYHFLHTKKGLDFAGVESSLSASYPSKGISSWMSSSSQEWVIATRHDCAWATWFSNPWNKAHTRVRDEQSQTTRSLGCDPKGGCRDGESGKTMSGKLSAKGTSASGKGHSQERKWRGLLLCLRSLGISWSQTSQSTIGVQRHLKPTRFPGNTYRPESAGRVK